MGSVRYISGSEFCIGCNDYEEKKQPSILFGFKQEWLVGYVGLMSGLSYEKGIKKDNLNDEDHSIHRLDELTPSRVKATLQAYA